VPARANLSFLRYNFEIKVTRAGSAGLCAGFEA